MEYIRQWKVGDRIFPNKLAAQRYEAEQKLGHFLTPDLLITNADDVIALLRPFATKRPRAPKGNGTTKRQAKSASAQATA